MFPIGKVSVATYQKIENLSHELAEVAFTSVTGDSGSQTVHMSNRR